MWFSIHGDWLRVSDPDWLHKLRRGMGLWLWALVLPLVLGFLIGLAGFALAFTGPVPHGLAVLMIGAVLLGLLAFALQVTAVFLITTREPALARTEDPVTLRRALRVLIIASLVGSSVSTTGLVAAVLRDPDLFTTQAPVATATLTVTTQPTTAPATPVAPAPVTPFPPRRMMRTGMEGVPIWISVWGGVCSVISVAGQVGLFVYLRRLARRIPARKLERNTTIVLWGYTLGVSFSTLSGTVINVAAVMDDTAFSGGRPTMAISCFAGLMGLTSFVFTIWLVVLLAQYRRALARAIATIRNETASG